MHFSPCSVSWLVDAEPPLTRRLGPEAAVQGKGVEGDDTEKRIALLEQRKLRLQNIKVDIERKASRIQDRMDGKPEKESRVFTSRPSAYPSKTEPYLPAA